MNEPILGNQQPLTERWGELISKEMLEHDKKRDGKGRKTTPQGQILPSKGKLLLKRFPHKNCNLHGCCAL